MNKKQLTVWGPYISLIGEENFHTDGIDVNTKFYCGPDFSQDDEKESYISGRLQRILYRHEKYVEETANATLTYSNLNFIFNSLIEKQFLDVELLHLIKNRELDITDEEYWTLVESIWTRQEFNSSADRKSRWEKIFSFRDKVPSLTEQLPDTFTAYRAGELDGFSWSLSKDVAQWFQERFRAEFGEIPLNEKIFSKSDDALSSL